MKVKQLLKVLGANQSVDLEVYTYGIHYASAYNEGFDTADKIFKHVRRDILDAKVMNVVSDHNCIIIHCELCK